MTVFHAFTPPRKTLYARECICPDRQQLFYQGDRELIGLQLLKLVCALMVVQIHTDSIIRSHILPFCQIAVPIFFFISGYFMISNNGDISSQKLIEALLKILKIAIFASVIYIILDTSLFIIGRKDALINYSSVYFWIKQIVFGDSIRPHLWYLTAYIQVLVIFLICIRLHIFKYLYALIPIGLCLGIFLGRYNFLSDSNIDIDLRRNTLSIAIPCVLIGILLRRFEHKLPNTRTVLYTTLVLICMLLIENRLLNIYRPYTRGDLQLFTIPTAISIFILFMRTKPMKGMANSLALLGKKHSLDIYLWHPMIATVISIAKLSMNLDINHFDTIAVATLTIAFIIVLKPMSMFKKILNF